MKYSALKGIFSSLVSMRVIMTTLNILDITVASATPATLMRRPITNMRFKITFVVPEIIRHIRGLPVWPLLLNIAAVKLYRDINGIPMR